ncbi:MAG: suppressor of fused domain protein [Gemmataceae bacterium]
MLTPTQKMDEAVSSGNVQAARDLLEHRPELLTTYFICTTWLHHAARRDNVEMIELLVSSGIDVNSPRERHPDNALGDAARYGCVNVARWLLDHGAKIRPSTQEGGGGTLIGAVNSGSLELVQLLLERGADVNGSYGENPRMNALSHAIAYGHKEIADLLCAYDAKLPEDDRPNGPSSVREEIVRHVERYWGSILPLALNDVVPAAVSISVHVVPPLFNNSWVTLFTTGMSEQAMTVPEGHEDFCYAELFIRLRAPWPLTDEALQRSENAWPVEWLRRVGHYPHDNNTWLTGEYALIANGEPPTPLAPNLGFTSLLLLAEPDESGQVRCRDGRVVRFYCIYPLFTEERDLALSKGVPHLLALFDECHIGTVVEIDRFNVAVD